MKLPAASCGAYQSGIAPKPPAFALKSYGAVRHTILSGRSLPAYIGLAKTDHPCSKLQGILAKANKVEKVFTARKFGFPNRA